jgi:hypothetical protein
VPKNSSRKKQKEGKRKKEAKPSLRGRRAAFQPASSQLLVDAANVDEECEK